MPIETRIKAILRNLVLSLSLLLPVAGSAAPTVSQLNAIAADLQTPTRYGVVLPPPAVPQATNAPPVTTGSYLNPQVYQFGSSWYLLAHYVSFGNATSTVLFSGPGPLGPWQKLSSALSAGTGWDSCLAAGSLGLVGYTWGDNVPRPLGSNYAMSYYGNAACNLSSTAIGVAQAQQPNQFTAWSHGSSPVLSPGDSTARAFETAAMYRSFAFKPVAPVGNMNYLMFATVSGDNTTQSIAAFGSTNGTSWRRYGNVPLISPQGGATFRQAANPQVFLHPSGLHVMAYSLTESSANPVDTFAASDDPTLLNWTKYQTASPSAYALLAPSPSTVTNANTTNYFYDTGGVYRPWLFRDRGTVFHYYNALYQGGANASPAVAVSSLAANGSFEDSDPNNASPSNWQTYCGAAGTDCDASYTDTAQAHSGSSELTHCKEADYDVATLQTIDNLAKGTYGVSAWVQSSGGQFSVNMTATGHGGTAATVPIGISSDWTQVVIPALSVTTGKIIITFASRGQAGTFLHVDDLVVTPLGRNFGFDQASYLSQDVASWTTTCTGLGGDCDADFVEQGGRSGMRLSHGSDSPFQVQTQQTLSVPIGTYYATVWVSSTTGCGQVGGSTETASSAFQVSGYGGPTLVQQVDATAQWSQIIIPNVQVVSGSATLSFISDCDANTRVSFDDVQFYRAGQQ